MGADAERLRARETKRELLEKILEVTCAQPALIAQEDTDGLLKNIEQRQLLLDALESVPPSSGEDGESVRLLRQIQTQDALNEKAAADQIEELRGRLRRLEDGRRTAHRYENVPTELGATYFDKQN